MWIILGLFVLTGGAFMAGLLIGAHPYTLNYWAAHLDLSDVMSVGLIALLAVGWLLTSGRRIVLKF